MSKQEDHFDIDEINNLIDNVEMVAHFLEVPITYKWKWVIIALHQALYGSLISALQGTDARQTVVDRQKESGKAVMLHVNRVPIDVIAASFGKSEDAIRELISNPYLISLDEALRRVKLKEYLPSLSGVQPLITSPEENDSIRKLTKEFRNEFELFAPKGWMIFTSGMPDMVRNVIRVISFLQFESNCVLMSDDQEKRLKSAISKIEQLLNTMTA